MFFLFVSPLGQQNLSPLMHMKNPIEKCADCGWKSILSF